MSAAADAVILEITEGVATITLNRPQVSNALARDSYGEIKQAVRELESDPQVGVIVITGAGKHFSAGGDIQRFKMLIDSGEFLSEEGVANAGAMTRSIRFCSKPVVAMVNGVATGAGLSLALACDFRVMAPDSKMIMGFIKMGLPGDTGSIYFLSRLIGVEKASKMMMTGEIVAGEEAVQIGLATLLSQGSLEDAAYGFAETLAAMPAAAIAKQKEMLAKYFYSGLDDYFVDEKQAMAECSRGPDFKEAVYAFLDKRTPSFNQPK